jgi:hypothetical protein
LQQTELTWPHNLKGDSCGNWRKYPEKLRHETFIGQGFIQAAAIPAVTICANILILQTPGATQEPVRRHFVEYPSVTHIEK